MGREGTSLTRSTGKMGRDVRGGKKQKGFPTVRRA